MNDSLILVVDDEPDICGEISGFLSVKGFQTIVAHNGRDALRLFKEHKPVLVLSDFKMPLMNGVELLKGVKSINRDVHVVLMSGAADGKTIVAAMKEAAFDFLTKPIDLNELLRIIRTAVKLTLDKLMQESVRRGSVNLISHIDESGDEITAMYLSADLDEYNAPKYEMYIRNLMDEGVVKKHIVLFLKNIRYMNNMGLNFLINLQTYMKERGRGLFLCGLSPQVHTYLRSLGYLDYFVVENTVESVVERVRIMKT
ncbi:MAG: response regulator [Spirochaetes bacterium]|nr:response regulator [Spirochaetota bacterium]